ncbi:MAG: hypothetical protein JSS66_07580 [Armatimonadetes bacterium]|nr:hypothetical protein [Armatimonadota bacterium]
MKTEELVVREVATVTGVVCDVTGKQCPQLDDRCHTEPTFDCGSVRYSGYYGSPYDMLSVDLDVHPDVVMALYLMSPAGKAELESGLWDYPRPRFKITIEEIE